MSDKTVSVTLTNETTGRRFSEWEEEWPFWCKTMGDLYRASQSEYGRCESSVYVDTDDGTKKVGWFFLSAQEYEDTGDRYLRGAWVSVA